MKKQNVAYLRVSTEAQTEKYGLDVQREKILEYCNKKGVIIDNWYIDGGYSGSRLDRPKIQELLNDAQIGIISTVYIYKLDRMSRDVIDTLNLLYRILPKYGVKVISATEDLRFDSPMDKVMIGVNAIMGQYEREVIYMRTRAGMVERVKRGLWMGGGRIPFGYYYDRNDGILHPKPGEAELVKKAYSMYIDGYSCDRISRILGLKGERLVSQILKRKSNIGYINYRGEIYKGLHEPIVDEKTFYQAQECMKKRSTNSHISNDHILTGLCYCGVCGARMRYHKWGGNPKLVCYSQLKGKEYMQKDKNCQNKKPSAHEIEKQVWYYFKDFTANIDKKEETVSKLGDLKSLINKSTIKVKRFYNLYAENPSDNLLEVIQEEEKRIKELKSQLDEEIKKDHKSGAEKIDKIRRVSDVWDRLTNKEKNQVLKECIEKIVIIRDDIEIHFINF